MERGGAAAERISMGGARSGLWDYFSRVGETRNACAILEKTRGVGTTANANATYIA